MKKILTLKRPGKKEQPDVPVVIKKKRTVVALPASAPKKKVKEKKAAPPPRVKKTAKTPPRKVYPVADTLRVLHTFWPQAFPREIDAVRPVKVGMFEDLRHDALQRELPLSGVIIKRLLRTLTSQEAYRQGIVAGAIRYDLHGEPAGTVTPSQAEFTTRHRLKNTVITPLAVAGFDE